MKNTDVIKGTQTIAQYKIMQFINQNFQPEALEIELIDGQTVKGTDRTGGKYDFPLERRKKDRRDGGLKDEAGKYRI